MKIWLKDRIGEFRHSLSDIFNKLINFVLFFEGIILIVRLIMPFFTITVFLKDLLMYLECGYSPGILDLIFLNIEKELDKIEMKMV